MFTIPIKTNQVRRLNQPTQIGIRFGTSKVRRLNRAFNQPQNATSEKNCHAITTPTKEAVS